MIGSRLSTIAIGAMLAGVLTLGAPALASGAVVPLPASDYAVRSACAAPAPGHAGCLALELVPTTAVARAHTRPVGMTRSAPVRADTAAEGAYGLRPQDLHSAYQLPSAAPSTQGIALIDAYDDPTAEADLGAYSKEFGLAECTTANRCFEKVNQRGETGHLPTAKSTEEKEAAGEWAVETSTDIEVAHAVCQNCHILLVEASNDGYEDLEAAERTAEHLGADEISNSWGGSEPFIDSAAFNDPGVVIAASAGDDGYLNWGAAEAEERGAVDYPASSPHVVAVGGTRLALSPTGAWAEETVWNGDGATGGGCSTDFKAQPWQLAESDWATVGCSGEHRAVADVAADGDPYTGVAVYDSTPERPGQAAPEWMTVGGTSVASPIVASVFALAGGADDVPYPAQTLYENELKLPDSLHDVVFGSNGECDEPFTEGGLSGCSESEEVLASCPEPTQTTCLAHTGYDGPSGVGTPKGITAFQTPSERLSAEEAERNNRIEGEKGKSEGSGSEGSEGSKGAGPPEGGEGSPEGSAGSKGEGSPEGEGSQSEGSLTQESAPGNSGQSAPATNSTLQSGLAGAPSGSSPSVSVTPSGSGTIDLTNLTLTIGAIEALDHGRPTGTQVAFAFTLSASTKVRVTLARQVRVRGHVHWALEPGSFTFAATRGHDRTHLQSRRRLSPGRYRLMLTPAGGATRWVGFVLG
jgi:hypothetical protein